ncbi:OsmC family peroxiredoxin [Nocardia nova]|uniref:OsmC family peroxiredoxin n=1 Tax=Nocardia nova TaxID=37330 RepID=UPI001C47081B|nr:OsmC family peroxiredoxin [Nocardia nova]MBV7701589.1 OsmC family peroxiredoxin [Nocardia nova]
MTIAERTATTVWEGPLAEGTGLVHAASDAWSPLPVTWAARTHHPGGQTSPEELAAAAHSSCFAMALALCLDNHHASAQRLEIAATVTLDQVDSIPTIVSSTVRVRAQVPGLTPADFKAVVDEAAALCPVSRLFAGAAITVGAELDTP